MKIDKPIGLMDAPLAPLASIAELERRLVLIDQAAVLAPDRILRRVIKHHRHLSGLGLQVAHRKCYVIERTSLFQLVDADELNRELPAMVILIHRPDAEEIARIGFAECLLRAWRLLFHGRIHLALEAKSAGGKWSAGDIQDRIERLGRTEFEEIRLVLGQENFLFAPEEDAGVYVEFAAHYLELRYFAPALVAHFYPGLSDLDRVDALLAEDVDAACLFAATRPMEAADPQHKAMLPSSAEAEGNGAIASSRPSAEEMGRFVAQAQVAESVGNVVRAAILRTQADPASGARAEMDLLCRRLQQALSFPESEFEKWRQALPALLPRAARGFWTVEARLLYDLQKVCLDEEREIYAVDLVEWGLSLGRRPLKRPLPGHREVLVVKHLRNAARLLLAARLADADRRRLSGLIAAAVHRSEHRLRNRFRPVLAAALIEVGLEPENLPEQAARHKLVEELLDQVVERGYLTMSDLRDALSRNQLKLPDLAGPAEFVLGDKLILLNRRLAVDLDGVYHRGEIYRRWLQRLSSTAFGTRPGRFLTRYLALPFGGAFVALEGLGHVVHKLGWHAHLATPLGIGLFGFFLLAMLHVASFRHKVLQGFALAGRCLRGALLDGPAWVLRLAPVRLLLEGPPILFFRRFFLKPLLLGGLMGLASYLGDGNQYLVIGSALAVFLTTALLFNSRLGRNAEEALADWTVRSWQHLSTNILPGLFRFVIDLFKQLVDAVERLLYTVDEWFRFHSGESRFLLPVKAVLGLAWFFVTYVIRFCLNLLIEPQINPIKHFPVVTVSHKLLLPFIPAFAGFLELTMEKPLAIPMATIIISSIPGIFGFLVWELKENWRLYRANRSQVLGPAVVGAHGETMVRLLKPGFHSGTIPRLFAKLRQAERRGKRRASRRLADSLRHVEECVAHFCDREFLELLRLSQSWSAVPLVVDKVHLATNRIRMETRHPQRVDKLTIVLDFQSGRIMARTDQPAWLEALTDRQRTTLAGALAGFYKLAAVDAIAGPLSEDWPNEMAGLAKDFGNAPLPWRIWVERWQRERAGTNQGF